MRHFLFIIAILIFPHFGHGQIHERLNDSYNSYQVEGFQSKRFKSTELNQTIKKYQKKVIVEELGKSMDGKPIHLITMGNGPTTVLFWSQMHGNEPTATMALMDIINFLLADDDMNPIREEILKKTTLYMIPMLNRDGGDRFERRNTLGVDLNRDAVRLQTPEAQILMNTRNKIQADFGFNLHDQNRRNGVGRTGKPASISFLSPAYNYEKHINENRLDAMHLISVMINTLAKYIPGQIGKYSDDFEPRAFGDNFQKLGTRTILIESGYAYNDDEKQSLRKMNYLALLEALYSISLKTYKNAGTKPYDDLPFNSGTMADLVIRNLDYELEGKKYLIDLAFVRSERETEDGVVFYPRFINDIGDLSTTYGYVTIDASGLEIDWGANDQKEALTELSKEMERNYLANGIHTIRCDSKFPPHITFMDRPVKFINKETEVVERLDYGSNPTFFLRDKNGVKYLISNGKAWIFDGSHFNPVPEE